MIAMENNIEPQDGDRLVRLPEVQQLTGICRTTIYRYVKNGDFPAPIKLGDRMSVWSYKAVQRWIADLTNPDKSPTG
jgi:prophage regulatory protein